MFCSVTHPQLGLHQLNISVSQPCADSTHAIYNFIGKSSSSLAVLKCNREPGQFPSHRLYKRPADGDITVGGVQ